MQTIRIPDLMAGVAPLAERLLADLNNDKKVLWLVPGGSNIPLAAAVMAELPENLTANLTVMLTDERYGVVGHADSNIVQLDDAGFDIQRGHLIPVLTGLSLKETVAHYAENYQKEVGRVDTVIGQFGMGTDGHLAGVLPGSPAVASADLAYGYDAPKFTRITLTPKALSQLNAAFVFALGAVKRPALEHLANESLALDVQPAQLIKQIADSYLYNDQIGEEL